MKIHAMHLRNTALDVSGERVRVDRMRDNSGTSRRVAVIIYSEHIEHRSTLSTKERGSISSPGGTQVTTVMCVKEVLIRLGAILRDSK